MRESCARLATSSAPWTPSSSGAPGERRARCRTRSRPPGTRPCAASQRGSGTGARGAGQVRARASRSATTAPGASRSRFRPVSQRMGPKRRSSSCAGLARWPSWTATTSRCRRGPTRKSPSSAVALWTSWLLWPRSRAPNPMWCSTEPTPIPRPFAPTAGQSGCGSLLRGSRPTTRSSSWSTVIPSGARSWWCRATGECTMVPWPGRQRRTVGATIGSHSSNTCTVGGLSDPFVG